MGIFARLRSHAPPHNIGNMTVSYVTATTTLYVTTGNTFVGPHLFDVITDAPFLPLTTTTTTTWSSGLSHMYVYEYVVK